MRAQLQITSSLRMLGLHGYPEPAQHDEKIWRPQVMQISALRGQGVDTFWATVLQFKTSQVENGKFMMRRQQQALAWMWERIDAGLKQGFRQHDQVRVLLPQLVQAVQDGRVAASTAARHLLNAYQPDPNAD